MSVYLDTHIVAWLATKQTHKFPRTALRVIDSSELLVSPIVLVELQYLFEINRLRKPPQALIDHLKTLLGLKISDHSFPTTAQAALSETWTRDVFDRLIVAQARSDDHSPLVTADTKVRDNYENAVWE